ncbi:unnamed protein product [Urochloa humidicola]
MARDGVRMVGLGTQLDERGSGMALLARDWVRLDWLGWHVIRRRPVPLPSRARMGCGMA